MATKNISPFIISILVLAAVAVVCFSFKKNKVEKSISIKPGGFAVVELFTSEGCSSCPPADEALEAMSKKYQDNVYLLGFHVDYWNRLGWKDEFSNALYTSRQQQYAAVFNKDGIYTPQAIVNGNVQFVGSDEDRLNSEIKKQLAAAENAAPVINSVKVSGNNVEVDCKANESSSIIICVALIQLHAVTDVKRGENEGRKLSHINIVRDFKTAAAKNITNIVSLIIPEGISPQQCKVIVYTQNSNTLKITGAAAASIQ